MEFDDTHINIGIEIRNLRKQKGISISELAQKIGLSTGLISQIERELVTPSVVSLWKIAKGLGVPIGHFFEKESPNTNPVIKKNERKKIITHNSNAYYELLSPNMKRKIEFMQITLAPQDSSCNELITHEGEECGIVIKGRLKVKLGDKEYLLDEGDSIYFNSTTPHRYINDSDDECISIWAMTPPSF